MKTCLLVLSLVILAQSIQPAPIKKVHDEERRELLAAGGLGIALVAACVSGVVGAVTGALTTAGINSCAGPRERTVIVIQQVDGTYRPANQDLDPERRRKSHSRRQLVVMEGVTYAGHDSCPVDSSIVPVALDPTTKNVAIPDHFFDPTKFAKLAPAVQAAAKEMTPLAEWKQRMSEVNDELTKTVAKTPPTVTGLGKGNVVVPQTPQTPAGGTTPQTPAGGKKSVASSASDTQNFTSALPILASLVSFFCGYWVRGYLDSKSTIHLYEELTNDI